MYNPSLFTQVTRSHILCLKGQVNSAGVKLPMNPAQSKKHFRTLLQTQSKLATLSVDEANIRAKLISIQTTLTPHMEILHKDLGHAKTLTKKNPNLSTLDD